MIDVLMEEHADKLSEWEFEFIEDLLEKDIDLETELSDGRQEKLREIYDERVG